MTERPSCCPLRTSNGRYTSTLFIYTEFSSKAPPRTLYCDDNSLCVLTPACCWMRPSTPFPDADGASLASSAFSSSVCPVCIFCPVTCTSANVLSSVNKTTCRVCLPLGCRRMRTLGLYPIIVNLTTTLSADCRCMLNSPFKEVKATFPCLSTETVASSTGLLSWSVTLPCSVNP